MTQIAAFTIVVDDMHRSLNFYRCLGLDAPATADARGFVTTPLGSGTQLAFKRRSTQLDHPGRLSIGVRCADVDEVDSTYRALVAAGHAGVLEPADTTWGARRCRLLDPDGNVVELFAPLP